MSLVSVTNALSSATVLNQTSRVGVAVQTARVSVAVAGKVGATGPAGPTGAVGPPSSGAAKTPRRPPSTRSAENRRSVCNAGTRPMKTRPITMVTRPPTICSGRPPAPLNRSVMPNTVAIASTVSGASIGHMRAASASSPAVTASCSCATSGAWASKTVHSAPLSR